jgi:hypothetical protein
VVFMVNSIGSVQKAFEFMRNEAGVSERAIFATNVLSLTPKNKYLRAVFHAVH